MDLEGDFFELAPSLGWRGEVFSFKYMAEKFKSYGANMKKEAIMHFTHTCRL